MLQTDTVELGDRFFADPDELYRTLRREAPVVRVSTPMGLQGWMVTRYADARPALNDPRLSKDASRFAEILERRSVAPERRMQFAESLAGHMLNSDPPDHTRLRKLVNRAFTVRAIARMRPRIEEIAQGLADRMAATAEREGTVDLLDEFAFPLPMTVICELLGVPEGERDDFRAWSNTLLSAGPAEEHAAAAAAMAEFLARLVVDKGARPGEDMLSAIVKASEDGDTLSANEATSMAFLLLVAGHETTVNLIGNGALALLRHPDQLALLRADPGLVPNAVEEFLRFDGPGQPRHFPLHRRAGRDRRHHHPRGGGRADLAGLGQPRSRSLWRRGATGRHARRGRAPRLRLRHTPLPGRPAGPAGGGDRVPHPARPLPGPRPRR